MPSFSEVLLNHGDDEEERRGALIPLLRENLMSESYVNDTRESESLLTMWLEGIGGGMEFVLISVILQTVSGERGAQWEDFVTPERLRGLLQSLGPAQIDSTVFLRILLFCLMRLLWRARRHWVEIAQAAGPYPDMAIMARSGEAEWELVRGTLFLVGKTTKVECRRHLLTFVHQIFLENSTLIKRLYRERCLTEGLCPWAVEMIPSLYILLESVLEDVRKMSSFDSWLLVLAANLALKYPLPRALELCTIILERCRQHGDSAPSSSLRVVILVLEAFPTLMESVMSLLVAWGQQHSRDPEFKAISQRAAHQIAVINERVKQPIYNRDIALTIS